MSAYERYLLKGGLECRVLMGFNKTLPPGQLPPHCTPYCSPKKTTGKNQKMSSTNLPCTRKVQDGESVTNNRLTSARRHFCSLILAVNERRTACSLFILRRELWIIFCFAVRQFLLLVIVSSLQEALVFISLPR